MNRVLTVAIAFVLGFLAGLSLLLLTGFSSSSLTSNVVKNTDTYYSYTRAICDDKNECIDVTIYCENGLVVKIKPISGFIQEAENWSDPRSNVSALYCD